VRGTDEVIWHIIAAPDVCRLDRLRADSIARSIPPEELRGATITLSNFGMIGGRFANLVIVPPQVAIIGAGRISQRAVAHRGQPAVRRVLPLSLTFDHRIVRRRSRSLPGRTQVRA
jgi:2-oxoisovalerate dehydrogenase E2 component (dihydrolipoyl transacylase)